MYNNSCFSSFSGIAWHDFYNNIIQAIDNEFKNCTDAYILNVNENDYISYLNEKFTYEPLTINTESEEIDTPREIREDLSQYYGTNLRYGRYRDGYAIKISYLFSGKSELFRVRPTPFTLASYEISVDNYSSRVSFEIKVYSQDVSEFQQAKKIAFDSAFTNLENINSCVQKYNKSLNDLLTKKFQIAKKQRLSKTNFFAAIKVKKSANTPTTYGIPIINKKRIIKPNCPTAKSFSLEPSLDIITYENIVTELIQVGTSMERKPSLYLNKDEEGLRDVFLTMLETRFDGITATGETFNHSGKTDILLKNAFDGSNLFIAECKFWHGPKHFQEAINQLFDRYLTWRDTKVALIVFVNGANFTTVLNSINDSTLSHPYYIRKNGTHGTSSKNYIFHLPQDIQKEVFLEIMAFNFDKNESELKAL